MSKKDETPLARRDFFRKATLGAGAVGALAAGVTSGRVKAETPDAGDRTGGRYRVTGHVKKYYELSKF